MRSARGFSLIELIITISIASLLAVIALPSYQKFSEKVKMQSAKALLSSLYSSEKMFHAEFVSYTSRLDSLGFSVEGIVYFDMGFNGDFAPPPGAPQGSGSCLKLCGNPVCTHRLNWTCTSTAQFGLDGSLSGDVTRNTFRAVAHAHLNSINGFGIEVVPVTITINH